MAETMKLKFKKTDSLIEYHSLSCSCCDGEVVDVTDSEGKRLLADFPHNFSEHSGKTDLSEQPEKNKMISGGKNK